MLKDTRVQSRCHSVGEVQKDFARSAFSLRGTKSHPFQAAISRSRRRERGRRSRTARQPKTFVDCLKPRQLISGPRLRHALARIAVAIRSQRRGVRDRLHLLERIGVAFLHRAFPLLVSGSLIKMGLQCKQSERRRMASHRNASCRWISPSMTRSSSNPHER